MELQNIKIAINTLINKLYMTLSVIFVYVLLRCPVACEQSKVKECRTPCVSSNMLCVKFMCQELVQY